MTNYIGLHTSLYELLDADSIMRIERIVWLRKVGLYEESVALFNEDLIFQRAPVVVIEWANTLLEQTEWGGNLQTAQPYSRRVQERI